MTKIQFELAAKPTKAETAAQGKTGFVVVATRWGTEQSNAWMERCKSLVKNFERTLSHATAFAQSLLHQTDDQKIGISIDLKWVL